MNGIVPAPPGPHQYNPYAACAPHTCVFPGHTMIRSPRDLPAQIVHDVPRGVDLAGTEPPNTIIAEADSSPPSAAHTGANSPGEIP
jgi:hypothetical protein